MSESEEGQLGHCGTFSVKSLGPLTFLDPVRGFPSCGNSMVQDGCRYTVLCLKN